MRHLLPKPSFSLLKRCDVTFIRRCRVCGSGFATNRTKQHTCSSACAKEWERLENNRRTREKRASGEYVERRSAEQNRAKWLAWKEKREPGYTVRYWANRREEQERQRVLEAKRLRREMYPGAHLPSKADAKRAGALCRTCGSCKPRMGSNYCRACTDYHTAASTIYEVRRKRGETSPRSWRTGRYCGPSEVDKEKASLRFAMFGHRCAWCGVESELLYRDHIIPRSAGGTNHPANIVPACFKCNATKAAKHPAAWVAWRLRHGQPITRYARAIIKQFTPKARGCQHEREFVHNACERPLKNEAA